MNAYSLTLEGEIVSCSPDSSQISRLLLAAHGVVEYTGGMLPSLANELVGMQVETTVTVVVTGTVAVYE